MKKYNFIEAEPLIQFIQTHQNKIIGKTLKKFYTEYWPEENLASSSCEAVVLEIDEYCIDLHYHFPSDITITVGQKEEIEQYQWKKMIIDIRNDIENYFDYGVKKELIEGCKIESIEIKHFSHAFECNPVTGEMRPDGGDYFSTIKLNLDSGKALCFCGASSICDGYIEIWCE